MSEVNEVNVPVTVTGAADALPTKPIPAISSAVAHRFSVALNRLLT